MDKHPSILIIGFIVIIVLAILVAFGGGSNGEEVTLSMSLFEVDISVFLFCAILVFLINWVAYIPAMLAETEHYYDLIGSVTYIVVITVAIFLTASFNWRALMVSLMVVAWAMRLGAFLFIRVKRNGRDDRFDEVKVDPLKFLVAWTLQAFWVLLTVACALVVITNGNDQPLDLITIVGIFFWFLGFMIEVIADQQKCAFRKKAENKNKFISSGLWAWSQHPNYFGEIILWSGMALIAVPVLVGWQWVAVISPFFIYLLLTKGSGIPTLEEKAQAKWGDNDKYQRYIQDTGILFPLIFTKTISKN